MNRRTFLASPAILAGCARDRRPRLNIFNWSAYIDPQTVPGFEHEFQCRVRYGIYESNEEMLARVMSGNSGWDIVFPTDYLIQPMRLNGLLAAIQRQRLPNLKYLDAAFQRPQWDPELEWSVPYMVTAAGIVYTRKLVPAPTAWADLWQDRLRGKITMLDDPFDVMGACLKKLGGSVNESDPAKLRAAERQALQQKPLVRAYINAEIRDQLVSGDVLAAQMWNTTAQQAIDATNEIAFAYPSEGYAVYPDAMVILRESRHQDLAHRFIDYMLRPSVAAANALAARTTTTNSGARALFPESFRNNPTLYPPADVQARGEWAQTMSPDTQRLRDRLWTEIKSS